MASTETPPIELPVTGDEGWHSAKLEMRDDFALNDAGRATFREFMLHVDLELWRDGRLVDKSVDLGLDAAVVVSRLFAIVRLPGDSLTPAQLEAGERAVLDARRSLDARIDEATLLYEEALLEYWNSENYARWRSDALPPSADERTSQRHVDGIYSVSYVSSGGDWKVAVAFEAADFPVLRAALQDLAHEKLDALRAICVAMGVDPGF